MTLRQSLQTALGLAMWLAAAMSVAAEDPADPSAVEFFEKSVRPILVERCIGCHGPEKTKGELRLDSRAGALAGGSSGPAIKPGDAEASMLVEAIRYEGDVRMPPKSKLAQEEIDVLAKWVARGAAWGPEPEKSAAAGPAKSGLEGSPEFARRAGFWSFQPIHAVEPPVVAGAWPRGAIDGFLLAAMTAKGLEPAPEADRRTLIRRLTFDLTGLPPTPEEVAAFLADDRADAYERLVERLLASPAYGERWGRHWLDLVRFAESSGHEFDYDILHAWRYRDYVVRAFNADLRYDQFVVEQMAGDLLPEPRRNPVDGSNESIQGTGFYWLGEGVHSPLDLRDEEVRRVDNQIDVLSKTFLGLTVSCARCHDHKFDPITQKDYYALAGFLRSTRHQQAFIDSDVRIAPLVAELRARKAALADILAEAAPKLPEPRRREVEGLLGTVFPPGGGRQTAQRSDEGDDRRGPRIQTTDLNAKPIAPSSGPSGHLLPRGGKAVTVSDQSVEELSAWRTTGDAFERCASPFRIELHEHPRLVAVPAGSLESGLISDRLLGVARSPTFTIAGRRLHVLASGTGGRVNVVIDGFEKIRGPIYDGLTIPVNSPKAPCWYSFDVTSWVGRRACLEASDGATAEFGGVTTTLVDGRGRIDVLAVRATDDTTSPDVPIPASVMIDVEALVRDLNGVDSPLAARLSGAVAGYREIEGRIPTPALAPAAVDGDGEDEFVMLRGSPRTLGDASPRRLPAILGGGGPAPDATGSGRLELARAMVDVQSNPLIARVIVNRIWKHHFGEGLARSTDDFGAMGQGPSHPELLDWLAAEFVRRGWSIKAMHRLMVESSAYRMAARATPEADRNDPTNALLHRANVRRLEAEAVRDSLLAVAGRLDRRQEGPSTPPYLSPFMEGRGRPKASGPLDGDGRRSLYLQVRRNFLNPLFLVFDAPVPFSTMGRRHASNVPAQALALLNDPLVMQLAGDWAARVTAEESTDAKRIERLYQEAFARPPTADESSRCLAYLKARREGAADDRAAWTDLAHALFNVKEFIYID
ncbi:PSD1 and planctomycete cytochrome C domain-containing protein [Paludisphaera rhizosphaerae]|uniref:PSD1 and planctomycete cytochrome C domain-containing protein n=1 Tax=Paludisphaera rhizosphaerae TaxID=2711216 RepID=UPI0013ECB85B|nr:PSD1 and planctomycete cytochrome C domain-containing protein [Paludisphaera rhizosphaerae]